MLESDSSYVYTYMSLKKFAPPQISNIFLLHCWRQGTYNVGKMGISGINSGIIGKY